MKEAEAELDAMAYGKYPTLTEAEIKMLVVDDKWLAAFDAAIHGEMDRISQALTRRVKELAERYESPLPKQVGKVADLEQIVNRRFGKDGFLMEVTACFKWTEIGPIPEQWNCQRLCNLIAFGTSITYGIVQAGPHVQNGIPYIKTGDMSGNRLPIEGLSRTSTQYRIQIP